jgi:hypothetical protein
MEIKFEKGSFLELIGHFAKYCIKYVENTQNYILHLDMRFK